MILINNFKKKFYKFIFYGGLNLFISNLILQILLLNISSIKATLVSQIVNFFLGYYYFKFTF